jgi:hypothetical protein
LVKHFESLFEKRTDGFGSREVPLCGPMIDPCGEIGRTASKEVRGFVRRVKRNGKLGRAVPVTAIYIPAREDSR